MPSPFGLPSWIYALACGVACVAPDLASAQVRTRVTIEENFRREPNGVVLARLTPGAEVRVLSRDGNWSEVELSGWVWLASLQASADPAFDLVVSAEGGENLRLAPQGDVLARLEEGALLTESDRNPSWARVVRTGWVWSASLRADVVPGAEVPGEAAPSATTTGTETAETAETTGPAARRPGGFVSAGAGGAALLVAPDGDTLAVATPGSDLQVVGREGSWARVRVEGWMWLPVTATADPVAAPEEAEAISPADLEGAPEAHAGRVVAWELQFISLERAEAVRTDFFEGEPFLLTRFGGPEGAFVYVALPPDRLTEVEGLVPLERITVTGRIRTAASELTGTPIVDLLGIERRREEP